MLWFFFIVGFQLVWNSQWKRGKFQVKRIRCRPIEYFKCQCNKYSLDQFHSLPTNALNCENRTAYTFFFIEKMFCFFRNRFLHSMAAQHIKAHCIMHQCKYGASFEWMSRRHIEIAFSAVNKIMYWHSPIRKIKKMLVLPLDIIPFDWHLMEK